VADGRLERFLNRFADVRGHEVRAALYLSGFFFLITFTFYIIKPVKESFLIGINQAWWAYADLATALLIGFVVALNARLLNRLPRRTYITATLFFFIASLFIFWFAFEVYKNVLVRTPTVDPSGFIFIAWLQVAVPRCWPIPVFVFCFWTDVFIAMSVTQFWISVNDVLDPHQGKRLVGLFVTGGLLGGIGGSLLAALMVIARQLSAEDLLLVCTAVLTLALMMVTLVYAEQKKLREGPEVNPAQAGTRVGYVESFLAVKRNRYLLLLAAMLASAMIVGSLINYQFKTAVKAAIGNADDRTIFLALFFLAILVVSTFFHLATTRHVLKTFGIRWALIVAPVLLLFGSLSAFFVSTGALLVWACLVRGGDKIFDNTISQSVRELLYIPVPAEIKYKAKIFIDMFVNKFATGIGAGLFFLLYHLRKFELRADQPLALVREIGLLALVFLVFWLVLTRLVYAEYPAVLKKSIPRQWAAGEQVIRDNVDVDLTLKIFDTLQSREKSLTLYLMNVFDLVRKNNLTPELKEALGIKQDELRARSLDSLFDVGGEVLFPGLDDAIADKDLASEIDLVFLLPSYQQVMGERLAKDAGSASEVDRMDAAKLVGLMVQSPETLGFLKCFLQDESPDVVTYALGSAAVHRRPEHVSLILGHLGNPLTAQEAQAALAAYGPGIEDVLKSALGDASEPPEVRRAIPGVLAQFGTQKSADILLGEMARHRGDMEPELIDALYKIRSDRPEVRFDAKAVRPELLFLIGKCYDLVLNPTDRAAGDTSISMPAEAKAVLHIKVKRVFDLMTLLHPSEDIVKVCQNILQGTRRSGDFSLEFLDNLLDRELKDLLFPLIEDLPPGERVLRMKKAMRLK
jgi:AAA family ATP:ADP antiporter